ncbi:MAG: polysaccharide biosynthesis tyrosine autokinase [Prevotella sp.]|nr:polysaccharide biosynthesis tyrosine autokinase [Prevotella sp.]
MKDNNDLELEILNDKDEGASFDLQAIYTAIVLNWKWFVLTLIISLGLAAIYLRYATPRYQAMAKMRIKQEDSRNTRGTLYGNVSNLGMISNSDGLDNEMEILKSRTLAEQTVRDLGLYVVYRAKGRVKEVQVYKDQPVDVNIDADHLDKLSAPISLVIGREGKAYKVTGSYYAQGNSIPSKIEKTFASLPGKINTRVGTISLSAKKDRELTNGSVLKATIYSPAMIAGKYISSFGVGPLSRTTTIARLTLLDEIPQRAIDYLRQITVSYNRQANEDKNIVAVRTEEFINRRIDKISAELGQTEGALQAYKKRNNIVELKMNAGQSVANQDAYSQRLAEANAQLAMFNSVDDYINDPTNKYATLPNVGLADQSTNQLITKYNEVALQRQRLLRTASETNPAVTPLTAQLDELNASIKGAMSQARKSLEIQRNSISSQFSKYSGQISASPEHERTFQQLGRQQEVMSGLYLMLLQKREENSIQLAATADKGTLIDQPVSLGKVSPRRNSIMLTALLLGLLIPAVIILLSRLFRYKIEGHDDVAKLTKLPIIADVAVANESAKTKADIVVHENKNNQMEEIFRSMRTNLQFTMKEDEKVILFTSSTSGEGKTFNAANLAVSFALLEKKVIIVGLDIRKPRLAELFEIDDHHHGITPLLTKDNPTWEEIQGEILPSGINNNLDLLLAGPIPPNPAELIARQSLDKVIDTLKEHYDIIIIDTAPVGLVTDTLQAARVADATIYVCRADYTPKSNFMLVNDLAADNKMPNISIVINGIDMSKKKYGYYYGYGRYGKYGRYGRYNKNKSYGYYGSYGSYGTYASSAYGDKNDTSVKR